MSSHKLAVLVGTHNNVNKSESKQISFYTKLLYEKFDLLSLKELAEGDEQHSLSYEKNNTEIIVMRFPSDLPAQYYTMFINSKLYELKLQTDYETIGFCIDSPI